MKHSISEQQVQEKKAGGINAFVLIFCVIVIATILTYIVPAGQYERVEVDGRSIINPESFSFTESSPVGFFQMFSNIHLGMQEGTGIIFFILIIGGAFGILKATGALDAFVHFMSIKLAKKEMILIPVLMFFFAAGGTLMGMSEETIVYIAIVAPLAVALGFDAIVGFAIVSLGATIGFTTAVMNPFNIGVAQGIAELPTFSGMGLRLVMFAIFYIIGVIYVYRYAKKIKADPSRRFLGNYATINEKELSKQMKLETRHKWVLIIFLFNFITLIIGVIKFDWYITEIAGLFMLFGIIIGIVGRLSANSIADNFIDGAREIMGGALIIGFAQTILVIFQHANLMDSILYYASSLLNVLPPSLNAIGMFIVQLGLNFLVPSGSGQAALTMPIMAPLADLVGVTRQTAVLAFQLGDGITNSIFPTAGPLMAGLAVAGIPFTKWVKWIWPFILIQILVGAVFLLIAQAIQYGPF
ncbi:YfcC family protein [Bacillus chungangensis]|uniref:Ion transporter superfamily protein YfcC n=1 Tax=Bacillus chungangensis TaxID=587633 RepID=A0ABT9WXT5_9BACI|nr:AbgT family transporter [Bacillus chungangensis]MDQ0178040.1 putative ion transporter superfamily protein YfcC [Bacillus chungangensis]